MNVSSYLCKRPNSQHWQLRMMVPILVRPIIGKREFTKSLGVTDRKQAENLAFPLISKWKEQIDAARSGGRTARRTDAAIKPTSAEIEEHALLIGYERAGERVQALVKTRARFGEAHYRALQVEFEKRHANSIIELKAGNFSYWRVQAEKAVRKMNWSMPEGSEQFNQFVKALAHSGTSAFAKAIAYMNGKDESFVPSSYVQQSIRQRNQRAKPGQSILEMFDVYAAQRQAEGKKRADTLFQDRKIINEFNEFIGVDRSLRSIEAVDVREWRNVLTAIPKTFRKRKEFAGLAVCEVAKLAKAKGLPGLSLLTVNKYLSALSALFAWALREGHADKNVVDGLFYDVDKQQNRRPSFNIDQLNKILQSPLFTGFLSDGKEFKTGEVRVQDWRYWIPLVCIFTGARVGEIAQLHVEDIAQQGELHVVQIRHEPEKGQVTKSGVSRPCAVHSTLEALGFLKFVEAQKERAANDGDQRLFPELKKDNRGQSSRASRFWRTYLERIGVKDGADGFGSHSFRHTLTDQLRLSGYFDRDIEVVVGHNQKTVTAGYGQVKQGTLSTIKSMIEDAKFEGVDFSHLVPKA